MRRLTITKGRGRGRGVKFANQVQKVFDRIASNPDLYAFVLADIRKAAVARFPYSVYYRAETARVEVLAVFHASRDPSIWKGRI